MNLSEKKLQDLKNKTLQFEELYDKYFYTQKDGVNVESVLKLLTENICSFQQIIDKFKSIKDLECDPCLYRLFWNEKFFEELIESDRLSKEDLKYLLNRIDRETELRSLNENTILWKYIVDKNILSFKELVDKFKSIQDTHNDPCLYRLLENKKLFKELIKNNRLTQDDLRYLLNRIDKDYELTKLIKKTSLLKSIVDNELFQELVDKFKNFNKFRSLLENKEFFEELIENNRLSKEDMRYLLNTADKDYELRILCKNTPLIKYILNEFILNKEDVDRFNRLLENDYWCKEYNIHTLFDRIEYETKNNEEVLKLNELNKKVYLLNSFDLNVEQRDELIEVLRNNEIARNRLIQIVDSNLENTYDFDSLMVYLKKKEKKNVLNI